MDSLAECVHERIRYGPALLQVMCGNAIPNRTWCQFEVGASEGFAAVLVFVECQMFLFTYRQYFYWVSCLKEFPQKPLCIAQKPQVVCVCVCVCERERETSVVFE